jgi:hypothetical protein
LALLRIPDFNNILTDIPNEGIDGKYIAILDYSSYSTKRGPHQVFYVLKQVSSLVLLPQLNATTAQLCYIFTIFGYTGTHYSRQAKN